MGSTWNKGRKRDVHFASWLTTMVVGHHCTLEEWRGGGVGGEGLGVLVEGHLKPLQLCWLNEAGGRTTLLIGINGTEVVGS